MTRRWCNPEALADSVGPEDHCAMLNLQQTWTAFTPLAKMMDLKTTISMENDYLALLRENKNISLSAHQTYSSWFLQARNSKLSVLSVSLYLCLYLSCLLHFIDPQMWEDQEAFSHRLVLQILTTTHFTHPHPFPGHINYPEPQPQKGDWSSASCAYSRDPSRQLHWKHKAAKWMLPWAPVCLGVLPWTGESQEQLELL